MPALFKAADVIAPAPQPWLGRLTRIPSAHVEAPPGTGPAERREAVLGRATLNMTAEPVAIGLSTVLPEEPEPEPEPLTPDEEAAEREAQRQAEYEAHLETVRADAYEAGRAEAIGELQAEAEMAKAAFAADIERLEARWAEHHERVERQLVALAIEAAEMIVQGPLPHSLRDAADRAVIQAVESLAGGTGVTVRVHPVDFLRLQEAGLIDGLSAAHPALRWSPDDSLQEGDWTIESAESAVRNVRAELMDGLRARLDLLQAVQDAPSSAPAPESVGAAPTSSLAMPAPDGPAA